jgi:small subunit ribosomal protein S3
MGQKANPIGNRLGIIRGWESSWFADKDYAQKVVEDEKIRAYLKVRRPKTSNERFDKNRSVQNGVSGVIIERSLKRITITIKTSKPGIIIGKNGLEVELMRKELAALTGKKEDEVQVNIGDIKKPELDAQMVGEQIAMQLESRINFKRAIKGAIQNTIRGGAQGIKVRISGRLNGAEMSRSEEFKEGRTPLHTFRADIDYALSEAQTVYGKIGIKVWIFRGEVLVKRELTALNPDLMNDRRQGGGGSGDRRGGGDRRDGGDRRGGDRREGGGGGDRRGGSGGGGANRGGGPGGNNRGGGGANRGGGGGGRR